MALGNGAADGEFAAALPGAGAHSCHAEGRGAGAVPPVGGHTPAVVLDAEADGGGGGVETDDDGGGAGVACDVGEGFLGDAEEMGFGFVAVALDARRLEVDGEAGGLRRGSVECPR